MRELRNVLERAVLTGKGEVISTADLRLGPAAAAAPPDSLAGAPATLLLTEEGIDLASLQESFEKHFFGEALRLARGNESKAAKLLNVNYYTFRYRRKKLGI